MDTTTAFDRRLDNTPDEWKGPLVDVIDTIESVKMGLNSLGIHDSRLLIEATRLVLECHDRAAESEQ